MGAGPAGAQNICCRGVTMNSKLKELNVDYLFRAILSLETMEECYRFFDDRS